MLLIIRKTNIGIEILTIKIINLSKNLILNRNPKDFSMVEEREAKDNVL